MQMQSASNGIRVVFVNVGWSSSGCDTLESRREKNETLRNMIANIVQQMHPVILCMREVGKADKSLNKHMMNEFALTSRDAWIAAVAEPTEVRCMYMVGFPYMTLYRADKVTCRGQKILTGLYDAIDSLWTARQFQCSGPDNRKVDIINVNASSSDHVSSNIICYTTTLEAEHVRPDAANGQEQYVT